MATSHRTRNQVLLNNRARSLGASQSNIVVSEDIGIVHGHRMRVDILVSSLTHNTGVVFKLQTSPCNDTAGDPIWKDVKSVSSASTISSDDVITISLNPEVSGDVAALPLGLRCRVLCTTNASEAVVIEGISVLEQNQ